MDEIVIVVAGIEPLAGSSRGAHREMLGGCALADALIAAALECGRSRVTLLHEGDLEFGGCPADARLRYLPCAGAVGPALAEVCDAYSSGDCLLVVHGATALATPGALDVAFDALAGGQPRTFGIDAAVAAVALRPVAGPVLHGLSQAASAADALSALALAVGAEPDPSAAQLRRVDDKWTLAQLEREEERRRVRVLCEAGLGVADPEQLLVRGSLRFGSDVYVDRNVIIEGQVSLGDRVRIGANCILRDASIAADSEVRPFSEIDGAEVATGSRIGPYARLRPGAKIGARGQIGNFVEIKEANIGPGARIGHLAFVGDAELGESVTIGAGSITCNHDTEQRNRTIIHDGAFIGSGVELVAPIVVGAGATVGSGSTVTQDVPAGQLTVARSRQTVVPGWKGPKSTRK